MKNIRLHGNKYQIRKWFDGKNHDYGSYETLEDARKVRDCLESVGWGLPKDPMRNISYYKGYYRLRKQKDGELIWSSFHKTLEEAQKERDLLEANDWSVDAIGDGECQVYTNVSEM